MFFSERIRSMIMVMMRVVHDLTDSHQKLFRERERERGPSTIE